MRKEIGKWYGALQDPYLSHDEIIVVNELHHGFAVKWWTRPDRSQLLGGHTIGDVDVACSEKHLLVVYLGVLDLQVV